MDKNKIIKIVKRATSEHVDWVRQGRMLVKGVAEDKIKTPQDCKGRNFGTWYTSEGYKLVNIPELEQLNTLNQEISKVYTALYYMTFDRRKKARSTLITADEVEVPLEEKQFRQQKLKDLEEKIILMIKGLKKVESTVTHIEEKTFDSVWLA
ncbi:MAG: hypothetical protein V3V19_02105 [Cocleimonas sp.]